MNVLNVFNSIDWPSIIIGAILGSVLPAICKFIVFLFKPHREKYHISLVQYGEEKSYEPLKNEEISIQVQFKGEDYSDSLSIIKIGLVNDGLNDLSFINHFDGPIVLKSKGYKIIDAQAIGDSKAKPDVLQKEDGAIVIKWGILKKSEAIVLRLVGVLDSPPKEQTKGSFFDSISFNVRSDCVDYISPRHISFKQVAVASFIVCVVMGFSHYALTIKENLVEQYKFKWQDEIIVGSLDYDDAEDIFILSPSDSIRQERKVIDFKQHPKVTIINQIDDRLLIAIIYLGLWLICLLVTGTILLVIKRRDNKKLFEE